MSRVDTVLAALFAATAIVGLVLHADPAIVMGSIIMGMIVTRTARP